MAGLPSELKADEIESRMFDLTALTMQLALAEGALHKAEAQRQRVMEIASLLEEKRAIPAVMEQLAYLASVQEQEFLVGITLQGLEELRLRVRGLVPLLDKHKRKIIYSDFDDTITGVSDVKLADMPKMTGAQYEKKVKAYLQQHLDHLVIHRLRTNQPLTETDLDGLEKPLVEIGEDEGRVLLTGLLAKRDAPTLAHFIRQMVGMDRAAAKEAFSAFLSNRSLSSPQIRFIEMIIDQLTARGVMKAGALYEAPFKGLHAGGPDALFAGQDNVIEGIFTTLEALHVNLQAKAG